MNGPSEYDAAKQEKLVERVASALKVHDGRSLLERYALYMMRVQMYELSLKQDLKALFGVSEDKADRMNLCAIFRYYVDNDVRAHPILYANVRDTARQRNGMAHEFLAVAVATNELAGERVLATVGRDLDKMVWELELAFQQYLILKETDQLYRDWGVKPQWETCS